MAKRSYFQSDDSERVERPVEVEAAVSEDVILINLRGARVQVAGPYTGRAYIWERAGSEVEVAHADAIELLQWRKGGCCGGTASPWFELKK